MVNYKYKTRTTINKPLSEVALNEYGSQGWELSSVVVHKDVYKVLNFHYVFIALLP